MMTFSDDAEGGSKSPTPTPHAPPGPRKCTKCGEMRPVDGFVRSWKAHLELMRGWGECNRCTWTRKSMTEQEFDQVFRRPDSNLIIQSNLTVPFGKCAQCSRMLPSRAFVRGLCPTVPATAKKDTCNACCLKNGDMIDESVVEYPKKSDDETAEPRECIVCFQTRSPEYYIRSTEPHAPVISEWLSCNHCSIRQSGVAAAIFATRYHGAPSQRVN